MTTREKFKRSVVELIHGLPYEEAIEKEYIIGCIVNYIDNNNFRAPWTSRYHNKAILLTKLNWDISDEILKISTNEGTCSEFYYVPKSCLTPLGLPITIGRVMQAFENINISPFTEGFLLLLEINWKLTKENGQECTDDDQTDETIEKLYNLIKKK